MGRKRAGKGQEFQEWPFNVCKSEAVIATYSKK